MTTYLNVLNEIETITKKLIELGLSDSQNFPRCNLFGRNSHEINYDGMQDLSIVLRNVEYADIYRELDQSRNYNIKMLDGALIQIMYVFRDSELISHRLAFFPSPFLQEFQNQPEIYELDDIYADIIARNILPVPVRFDYDPGNYQELDHPKCHLTLGQFKNCRIPVCSPIMPSIFIHFILRNFYNTAFRKFTNELKLSKNYFQETITFLEKQVLHISIH
ncbi:DUF2290 domain-containing protein [Trichocoleus sp. FACHB-262]|uniref:DUF2290 domain-containing protein n=1 Tax=Trichocoleus sp. FACHB-262 TaxID=2692869 RepID=UPI0016867802|nr:DUF2290 domain-containing protein [Trichocoleus sp. FACHB-262]MBD2122400.1 DUF2290 domain-containing protein [Trichocoleus sp. FACHB-262]